MAGTRPDPTIEVGELSIRPLTKEDAPMLAEWFADPEVFRRWWGHESAPYTSCEIEAWFERDLHNYFRFLIVEDEGVPVAFAQVHGDRGHVNAYIDGFVEESARGRGIGPVALRAIAEYVIARGYYRALATHEPDNVRGVRACEKAGFRLDATTPSDASDGRWVYPPPEPHGPDVEGRVPERTVSAR